LWEKHLPVSSNRRTFLHQLSGLPALAAWPWGTPGAPPEAAWRVSVFSKHLSAFGTGDVAEMAAEAGFEGIDLTVRPGGHVLPEHVADELPRAVEAARRAGLSIPTLVTALTRADAPHAEALIRTAAAVGVRAYRTGWLDYDFRYPIARNLERHRAALAGLAQLNARYGMHGAYQNHSGVRVGSAVWDLAELLRGTDPRYLGCQYDLHHATIEGANSWVLGLRQVAPLIRTVDVKDFRWTTRPGTPRHESVPLGEGIAPFPAFFRLARELGLRAEVSLHVEYPVPAAGRWSR
jgi:L-ribulose-5-phosphate 3-epimerase